MKLRLREPLAGKYPSKSHAGHDAEFIQQLTGAVQSTLQDFTLNNEILQRQIGQSFQRSALASVSQAWQQRQLSKGTSTSVASLGSKLSAFFNHQPTQQQDSATGDKHVVCLEFTKGKRRVYRRKQPLVESSGFDIKDDHVTHRHRVRDVFQDYMLPQGYPESVAPQYGSYMLWRGVQYFFGGAMSVFTTRSLLSALGVSRNSGEAAAAINWVLKDGAGRFGRFLFARWGRQLDCELKQFRLAGDALMEMGATLELATALAPQAFLPLACTANLAKNLAAVASSATRAPIYRTFAKHNNMADITAKGESVANLADIVGTSFGIALAKINLPVWPTFMLLSVGYLVASRREVDSVVLPYLNRARLSYAGRKFLDSGGVPGPIEANAKEPLTPWSDPLGNRIVLGASVDEACCSPQDLESALREFSGRQYAITYRPDTRKAYVLLKEGVTNQQMLRATFDAQVLLFMISSQQQHRLHSASRSVTIPPNHTRSGAAARRLAQLDKDSLALDIHSAGWPEAAVRHVAKVGPELYSQFERQAIQAGWRMNLTMLNASETRFRLV